MAATVGDIIEAQPEWHEPYVAAAMLSDGPSKDVNPTAFRDRCRFWTNIIQKALQQGALGPERLSASLETLAQKIAAVDGRRPKSLRIVLEDGLAAGTFVALRTLASEPGSASPVARVVSFAWTALSNVIWGLSPPDDEPLVCVALAETAAMGLHQRHCLAMRADPEVPSVLTFEQLAARYGDEFPVSAARDCDVIAAMLVTKGLAVVDRLRAHRVIKFLSTKATKPVQISEDELTVLSIRLVITSVEGRERALDAEISQLDQRARELVAQKATRDTILAVLRRKRMKADMRLEVQGQLHNMEHELQMILMAQLHEPVVTAMERGAKTLKALLKTTSVDRVERVADELADLADEVEDIDAALMRATPSAVLVDEDELETELASLVALPPTPSRNSIASPLVETPKFPTVPQTTPLPETPSQQHTAVPAE